MSLKGKKAIMKRKRGKDDLSLPPKLKIMKALENFDSQHDCSNDDFKEANNFSEVNRNASKRGKSKKSQSSKCSVRETSRTKPETSNASSVKGKLPGKKNQRLQVNLGSKELKQVSSDSKDNKDITDSNLDRNSLNVDATLKKTPIKKLSIPVSKLPGNEIKESVEFETNASEGTLHDDILRDGNILSGERIDEKRCMPKAQERKKSSSPKKSVESRTSQRSKLNTFDNKALSPRRGIKESQQRKSNTLEDLVCPICDKTAAKLFPDGIGDLNTHASVCNGDSLQDKIPSKTPGTALPSTISGSASQTIDTSFDEALARRFQKEEEMHKKTSGNGNEDVIFCQICQKDLTHMNSMRRGQHVNRCIDSSEQVTETKENDDEREKQATSTDKPTSVVNKCPMCDCSLPIDDGKRSSHLKQCAKKNKISTQRLMKMIRQLSSGEAITKTTLDDYTLPNKKDPSIDDGIEVKRKRGRPKKAETKKKKVPTATLR